MFCETIAGFGEGVKGGASSQQSREMSDCEKAHARLQDLIDAGKLSSKVVNTISSERFGRNRDFLTAEQIEIICKMAPPGGGDELRI